MNIFCTSLMHKGGDRRKRIKEESESSDTYSVLPQKRYDRTCLKGFVLFHPGFKTRGVACLRLFSKNEK